MTHQGRAAGETRAEPTAETLVDRLGCVTCGAATYPGREFAMCDGCDQAQTFCTCARRARGVWNDETVPAAGSRLADRLERETAGMTPGPWQCIGQNIARYLDGIARVEHDGLDRSTGEDVPAEIVEEQELADAVGIVALRNARDEILAALRAVPAAPAALNVERLREAARRARLPHDVTVADIENIAAEYAALAPSADSSGTAFWQPTDVERIAVRDALKAAGLWPQYPNWADPAGKIATAVTDELRASGWKVVPAEQPSHPAAPLIGEAE